MTAICNLLCNGFGTTLLIFAQVTSCLCYGSMGSGLPAACLQVGPCVLTCVCELSSCACLLTFPIARLSIVESAGMLLRSCVRIARTWLIVMPQ